MLLAPRLTLLAQLLEEALVERCQVLSEYPEIIGYYIYYNWWPEEA